jgi:hypothetical protein
VTTGPGALCNAYNVVAPVLPRQYEEVILKVEYVTLRGSFNGS